FDRLQIALAEARRYRRRMALLFLDLDGFKEVNDRLGHEGGDQVLLETGRRLQAAVRGCDTVARLGGDEFTVILGNVDGERNVSLVAERLLADISAPISTRSGICRVGASIGISMFPEDGADSDTLLKRADLAMYGVKHRGKNGYMGFMEPEVRAVA
ncbi:MAG TPA: GGDEF domain-containing protein, partial [Verrucomicrobiae bacterium]|nr:GGDEF domain-containing protein [Verrucomicrobiae bacterium]